MKEDNLDKLLTEIGGFGKYQIRVTILLLVVTVFTYFTATAWLFETKGVNHRCRIPRCDENTVVFKPSWWMNAIPSIANEPVSCGRYKRISNISEEQCNASDFNKNLVEICNEYIYETSERSILQDFDLHCEENLWKLTSVGTLNSIGNLLGLPIAGILSDKYGRKTILIISISLSSLTGLIRSFANSYVFFISMVFVDSLCNAATYTTTFILDPHIKKIVLRPFLRILYGVQLIILAYYWLLPESVRWLLIKARYLEAQNLINQIGKRKMEHFVSLQTLKELCVDGADDLNTTESLKHLFKSCTLATRLLNCIFCWIIGTFVYYGLTINSVTLSSNTYLDFILTVLVEIPASAVTFFLMGTFKRRFTLCASFLMCGICCIAFIFIPKDFYWLRLCTYLLGKSFSAIDVSLIYTIASEMFPTTLRNSLVSVCSMFGRIGSMVAPQIPLLELLWKPLPLVLFGSTSLIACALSLMFPETKNTKLPDTIEESKYVGRHKEIIRLQDT
ncbi:hypothetical protein RI129_001261 [Pyrocoelia pectoralis]|uniref:Uncharacterized protein n=1 Tax=Pyrocoelia pectoralis TaxID=417401 RepID=A0AAN7VKF7_9COLE